MFPSSPFEWLFAGFAIVLGAIVGSFLNVVIHRLPRGLSVNEPKRSFCPSCEKQIPWYHNLPLVSWLVLRGKCAFCSAPISLRYFGVELLTALLFLALWLTQPIPLALVYAVFVALVVAATFIDFEHYIIPDEITWGSVFAGVILSCIVPAMHDQTIWWQGALQALLGAAVGYFGLWAVVEGGKLAFGKKKVNFDEALPFHFERDKEQWVLVSGEDRLPAEEVFSRESDELLITCRTLNLAGKTLKENEVRFRWDRVVAGGHSLEEAEILKLKGTMTRMIVPREAMGFGDVKFLAGIGAFLGWQAVAFTVFSASVVGAVVGISFMLAKKEGWGTKLPFGPYLALGALIWLFGGDELWRWYFARLALVDY